MNLQLHFSEKVPAYMREVPGWPNFDELDKLVENIKLYGTHNHWKLSQR